MNSKRLLIHIVCFNSADYTARCVDSLRQQEQFILGSNLTVHLTDNASLDKTLASLKAIQSDGIEIFQNSSNLGFCAAHNQGVKRFLSGNYDFLLILNPDLVLASNALIELTSLIEISKEIGSVTPLLLRADQNLKPIEPKIVDAAGMTLNNELRHFDRGSGEKFSNQFPNPAYVFGGSGACLLMKRAFIEDLLVEGAIYESDIDAIYPQLASSRSERALLFDEAFFAYREDADLAWRAQSLDWRCLFVPSAIGYHVRYVTPEKRKQLPAVINLLGVRNRFLLQLNNLNWKVGIAPIIFGFIVRNTIVLLATILIERKSLLAFKQVGALIRRALERRRLIRDKIKVKKASASSVSYWFKNDAQSLGEIK